MKKIIFSMVVLAAIALVPNRAMAQSTVSGTTAGANIVTPILLEQTETLHFGTMSVLSGAGGTCVLATDNTRTKTGGVNLSAANPASKNAAYKVSGAASTGYAISLPATITVNGPGGASMLINTLTAKPASQANNATNGTLDGSGADTFTVGGTLNVAANQATGAYTGTFDVTVAYN
jgi:hypothetical protein